MLVKLENPVLLTKIVEIISELVTEVRIKINEGEMSISAMDPANVAMVGFKISKSAFSQYEVSNDVLGINLESLKQILKRCSAGSSLILEKKENLLKIQIYDRIKRNFTLNLIDIESEDIDFKDKISKMEFSSLVELSSNDLIASIEDCGIVADSCSFIIKDGKFIIEAKSLNSAMSEFSGDEAKIQAENCKAKYSLEYLQKFMKGAKLSEKSVLHFAEDHPLKINFKNQDIELSFILAPRVENED
jgi:proliferating cell nuclear antigen|tara:strand:- start:1000 stop:1737 length:738 start_codon:yes stop_codon:yes gene_type:complete